MDTEASLNTELSNGLKDQIVKGKLRINLFRTMTYLRTCMSEAPFLFPVLQVCRSRCYGKKRCRNETFFVMGFADMSYNYTVLPFSWPLMMVSPEDTADFGFLVHKSILNDFKNS